MKFRIFAIAVFAIGLSSLVISRFLVEPQDVAERNPDFAAATTLITDDNYQGIVLASDVTPTTRNAPPLRPASCMQPPTPIAIPPRLQSCHHQNANLGNARTPAHQEQTVVNATFRTQQIPASPGVGHRSIGTDLQMSGNESAYR